MEEKLKDIDEKFQSGKHKEAIAELGTLIQESASDDSLYLAYNSLGQYLNYMGQHEEAVQAWEDSLKHLQSKVEQVDKLREDEYIDWINISIRTARHTHRLGKDGPGVSYRNNKVCYSSSGKTEAELAEWKTEKFESAAKHFKQALEHIPAEKVDVKKSVQLELADVLYNLKKYDDAVKIYEDTFFNDGDPKWLHKAAECLWMQDKKESTYMRLQQLLGTDPSFADAYQMLATYFSEKNDTESAEAAMDKFRFYSWIPKFCSHIEFSPENYATVQAIQSDGSLEYISTTLAADNSRRSTEFLTAVCYHHYHGPIENTAFNELERRGIAAEGDEREFIGTMLMNLLKSHQSVCTVKGAASALAGMKFDGLFELLVRLLPQDVNTFFPMNIPASLAKLEDPRAIPVLLQVIENSKNENNYDSDSSDDMFFNSKNSQLAVQCCIALLSFIDNENVKNALINAANDQETREACLAVLGLGTNEKQYFDELETILRQKGSLNFWVTKCLQKHADKSSYAEQLLVVEKKISTKQETDNDEEANEQ